MGPFAPLFEDRHADARFRWLIPRFARLGAALVAVTTPFVTHDPQRRLALAVIVAVAFAAAQIVAWRRLIYRMPHWSILGLLGLYAVLIALATAAAGEAGAAYDLFMVLPVMFAAVFFTGWVRYGFAVAAMAIETTVLSVFVPLDAADSLTHVLILLLVAHFGANLSDTLREAHRSNRALHSVLEAATKNPLDDALAEIGLEAALSVADWEVGAVLTVRDGEMRVAAAHGVSELFAERYERTSPGRGLAAAVIERGDALLIDDARDVLDAGHPIIEEGLVSIAALPVRYHDETVAVLALAERRRKLLDDRQRDRLERVAGQLGLALGASRAYRKEAEIADGLRELNQRKDNFLANVSHELRTPAAAIKLVSSVLRRPDQSLEPEQTENLYATIERRADQMCALIDNLLDQALADSGQARLAVAPFDWVWSLGRWVRAAEETTGREIDLQTPDAEITAVGDAGKLERVVSNLLSNAAKFSEPGTPIVVRLRAEGEFVRLDVADNGAGIPDHAVDSIFDRFVQVDAGPTRKSGGFGIGLSLARHYVEAHGGRIEVVSETGKGSTFTVTIPRLVAASPRRATASGSRVSQASGSVP